MGIRWGPGPVFYFEWLMTSRRWQLYAGRASFLLILLGAMTFGYWSFTTEGSHSTLTLSDLARLGETFFYALMGTQLVLVLLAAPASTAGSICLDKARGTLTHLLVTDLSNAEIVLGKLAARVLPVLSLIAGTLPLLALSILLGGLDPTALAGAFIVTVGVALLGCTLSLTLSVWGHKVHEVILFNYLIWIVVLLAYPTVALLCWEFFRISAPRWPLLLNPFWLVFAPYAAPGTTTLVHCVAFLGGTVGLSVLLALVAILRVRAVAVQHMSQPNRRRRRLLGDLPTGVGLWRLIGPSLDPNPVLWREWHRRRPSRWSQVVWVSYALGAIAFSGLGAVMALGSRGRSELAVFVNAFQVSIGLLLLSVTSSTSLSEERVCGSLDVLLTTPLPTPSIVWGKWWGAFRTVPLLAILPCFVALVGASRTGRVVSVPLLGVLVITYGAAITSLGLAAAVWFKRLGRAIAASVAVYVLATVAWPFVIIALFARSKDAGPGLAMGSPFFGGAFATILAIEDRIQNEFQVIPFAAVCWSVLNALLAAVLLAATLRTFDRHLGRITARISGVQRRPVSQIRTGRSPTAAGPTGGVRHPSEAKGSAQE